MSGLHSLPSDAASGPATPLHTPHLKVQVFTRSHTGFSGHPLFLLASSKNLCLAVLGSHLRSYVSQAWAATWRNVLSAMLFGHAMLFFVVHCSVFACCCHESQPPTLCCSAPVQVNQLPPPFTPQLLTKIVGTLLHWVIYEISLWRSFPRMVGWTFFPIFERKIRAVFKIILFFLFFLKEWNEADTG